MGNGLPRDTEEHKNKIINCLGLRMAEAMGRFTGSVQINISEGRYMNAQITQKIKPKSNK